ncbi:MAG: hypothetical protein U1E98_05095 [Moraxella osloensis]
MLIEQCDALTGYVSRFLSAATDCGEHACTCAISRRCDQSWIATLQFCC